MLNTNIHIVLKLVGDGDLDSLRGFWLRVKPYNLNICTCRCEKEQAIKGSDRHSNIYEFREIPDFSFLL